MIGATLFETSDLTSIANVTLLWRDVHNLPVRNLNTQKLADTDGEKLIEAVYSHRNIVLPGQINASSRAGFEAARDAIIAVLQTPGGVLDVPLDGGGARRYYASLSNLVFNDKGGGFATFDIEFRCSDPVAYDTAATAMSFTSITAASNTQNFTFGGMIEALPVLTYTISALTGGTAKTVTIGGVASAKSVAITRDWTAGDVLVVNCFTKRATVNGTLVDYTGAFPYFPRNVSTGVTWADNFTTRTVAPSGSYTKRYL